MNEINFLAQEMAARKQIVQDCQRMMQCLPKGSKVVRLPGEILIECPAGVDSKAVERWMRNVVQS